MRKLLIITAAVLAFASAAQAGDNSCLGTIIINGDQAKVVAQAIKLPGLPEQPAWVCATFSASSAVGQKILKVCPNGSTCLIDQPLPRGGDVSRKTSVEIKKPTAIERVQQ
jgi:hypothetical protein